MSKTDFFVEQINDIIRRCNQFFKHVMCTFEHPALFSQTVMVNKHANCTLPWLQ